jgi:hypothetical protein
MLRRKLNGKRCWMRMGESTATHVREGKIEKRDKEDGFDNGLQGVAHHQLG